MKHSLGIIGIGAFGEFILKYLTPYFSVMMYDSGRDLTHLTNLYQATSGTLQDVAAQDIVIIATPIRAMDSVLRDIAPYLKVGQWVMDVASVKEKPAQLFEKYLPSYVHYTGLHPLFGPQSGRKGLHDLNIVVCPLSAPQDRIDGLVRFLSDQLGLNVILTTPTDHDQQMAYTQGLTHLMTRVFLSMNAPEIVQRTKTYEHFMAMIDLIKNDSDALFLSIQKDNPYSTQVKEKFFDAARAMESFLNDIDQS
jgi:prephenate dehydrogenase